ncbi:hypothetical protein N7495_005081 [Penicillium taxi]|uniref:uncharacterized protein n=1 Tax=Penicillium taxi TaxID=168475 RepID=UPI0025459A7F|nr:uncharacterized protein N7495_005081 [Penicillium taxi]KAJ5893390.1 hypothetical protein N7495_005081 [Penicillium taxi]
MIRVGPEKRLFAAHESIINASPYFRTLSQAQPPSIPTTHIHHSGKYFNLPDELPEVLSCILEFLYKGDYSPRLRHNANSQTWELEENQSEKEGDGASPGVTVYHHGAKAVILRDTAIYCAAEKYQLPALQRLALRKQGLHTGIQCHTILASARYAYANTPDNESKLRAHYLALMMRCRNTFKRSGTMQAEMEKGGTKMFFDLFVAMCNYMDEVFPADASVCSSATVKRHKV